MHPSLESFQLTTRRHFLRRGGVGLGALALAGLTREGQGAVSATPNPLAPRAPVLDASAKRVIYLHMTGSPPNLDLFDYKPELVKRDGQACPDEFLQGKRFAFTSGTPRLMGTPRKFAQYGEGGVWMSGDRGASWEMSSSIPS